MNAKVACQVFIDADVVAILDNLARSEGNHRNVLIRRAIHEFYKSEIAKARLSIAQENATNGR